MDRMPNYRAFPLDTRGHVVAPPRIIEAETAAQAIVRAMQLVDGRDLEVWDAVRRVGLIRRRSCPHQACCAISLSGCW